MSRETLFLLTAIALSALLVSSVAMGSSNRKLSTVKKRQEGIDVPTNSDKALGYSELNLAAPRLVCAAKTGYASAPHATLSGSVPMASVAEADVTPTVSARLTLTDSGALHYSLNSVVVWRSSEPRTVNSCTELDVLKGFVARAPPQKWAFVAETNGMRLHAAPLAITASSQGGSRRILWTFLSGWDLTSVCAAQDCELPLPLPEKASGVVALISQRRTFRLALLPNGDLAVLETGPDEPRGSTHVTKLASSLMATWCAKSRA